MIGTIRKWSGGLFLLGIGFNLFCVSSMNFSGICPVGMPGFSKTVSEQSLPPCHEESPNSTSSESSAPCCSSEILKVDSVVEFRFKVQKLFQSNEILILFFFPMEWTFNSIDLLIGLHRDQNFSLSDFKTPRSFLQVFRI